jgi:hypothetical protein
MPSLASSRKPMEKGEEPPKKKTGSPRIIILRL